MNPSSATTDPRLTFTVGTSSLGLVLAAASGEGLAAVLLGDHPDVLRRDLATRYPDAVLIRDDGAGRALLAGVVRAIEDPARAFAGPLAPRGSPFQRRVWDALRSVPAGTTVSYAELAQRIGAPRSVRAVAAACAANPVAVIVPCHRVVRSDGALSGYRWGVDRKRRLLEREGAIDAVPSGESARTVYAGVGTELGLSAKRGSEA